MINKYKFKKPSQQQTTKVLVCPKCEEMLSQIDISSYGRCPYCDQTLEATPELEDYLLKPAVDHWVMLQNQFNPIDLANFVLPDEEMFE